MTQKRVVKLFRDTLDYAYLGNWIDRPGNANIEVKLLRAWLKRRGVDEGLITRRCAYSTRPPATRAKASTTVTRRSTRSCGTA